jgi:lipid II:glycine glycyltransferase (peptidoglycan interpeptide bridge formation enzyme)
LKVNAYFFNKLLNKIAEDMDEDEDQLEEQPANKKMKRGVVSYPSKQDDGTEKVKRKGKKVIVEVPLSLSHLLCFDYVQTLLYPEKESSEYGSKCILFWQNVLG